MVYEKLLRGLIKVRDLERHLYPNFLEAVNLRRKYYLSLTNESINKIPVNSETFNYENIYGKNVENVIGTIPIPVGMVGPLVLNGVTRYVPFATTEGALVASLSRGCKVLNLSGGVKTIVEDVGITRAPLVRLDNIHKVALLKIWLENNWERCKEVYEKTSNYSKLKSFNILQSGNYAHIRFSASTGNAMGMNMITIGVEKVMELLKEEFPELEIISFSGNVCVDKKASAMNWINGRSKKVVAEGWINYEDMIKYLKINPYEFERIHTQKNLVGSSLAGTIGGNNAQASNIIAGLFVSTGQDLGQIGTSSFGITNCELLDDKVRFGITMPSLEVATIGGGTSLESQRASLEMMNIDRNKENASCILASVCASLVLSGELSLLSAHTSDNFLNAHKKLGRNLTIK